MRVLLHVVAWPYRPYAITSQNQVAAICIGDILQARCELKICKISSAALHANYRSGTMNVVCLA